MKNLKASFKYTINQYNVIRNIFKNISPNMNIKTSAISMQNTIHKTEENLMQKERRKREKMGSTTKSGNLLIKHKHADNNFI